MFWIDILNWLSRSLKKILEELYGWKKGLGECSWGAIAGHSGNHWCKLVVKQSVKWPGKRSALKKINTWLQVNQIILIHYIYKLFRGCRKKGLDSFLLSSSLTLFLLLNHFTLSWPEKALWKLPRTLDRNSKLRQTHLSRLLSIFQVLEKAKITLQITSQKYGLQNIFVKNVLTFAGLLSVSESPMMWLVVICNCPINSLWKQISASMSFANVSVYWWIQTFGVHYSMAAFLNQGFRELSVPYIDTEVREWEKKQALSQK